MKSASAFALAVLALLTLPAGTAWANGEEFFAPAKNSKIDLVYYGRIKDSQTGRSITDSVYFVLTDNSTGLSFPFTNDKPGHFRTPDVGTAIKEIGEKIDTRSFVVTINVAGYKRTTISRMPRKGEGTVELDVRLDPVAGDVSSAGLSTGALPPFTWIAILGLAALAVLVKTFSRRSTAP